MSHIKHSTDAAPESAWFKSTYSQEQAQSCVEIAELPAEIGIRDSKDKSGPALLVSPAAFASFVDSVRA